MDMPGPKGGNKDVVDALNGIFDAREVVSKASEAKEKYNLTDKEFLELQDALLQQKRGALEKAVDEAVKWGVEITGRTAPVKRSPDEILNAAKTRLRMR
jgi:hypothetical protein